MNKFHDVYPQLLFNIMTQGVLETNRRTNHRVLIAPTPRSFTIGLGDGMVPVCGLRKLFPATAAAEVAWFLMGDKDPTWINERVAIWRNFVEADGTIPSAYGYRWRNHFGRDQLQSAVDTLTVDRSDRQCLVSAWDPSSDGLGHSRLKNVPCPAFFQPTVVGGNLHVTMYLRSSDAFVGLPYDVMGYALLAAILAETIGVGLGSLHVTAAHVHVYETHWEMVKDALRVSSRNRSIARVTMPNWTLEEVVADPDGYVAEVKAESRDAAWPKLMLRPEIVL